MSDDANRYQYVLEIFKKDGRHERLGAFAVKPDWEPALEWRSSPRCVGTPALRMFSALTAESSSRAGTRGPAFRTWRASRWLSRAAGCRRSRWISRWRTSLTRRGQRPRLWSKAASWRRGNCSSTWFVPTPAKTRRPRLVPNGPRRSPSNRWNRCWT